MMLPRRRRAQCAHRWRSKVGAALPGLFENDTPPPSSSGGMNGPRPAAAKRFRRSQRLSEGAPPAIGVPAGFGVVPKSTELADCAAISLFAAKTSSRFERFSRATTVRAKTAGGLASPGRLRRTPKIPFAGFLWFRRGCGRSGNSRLRVNGFPESDHFPDARAKIVGFFLP